MRSISAKLLLCVAIVFFSCSRESSEPLWEPQSHLGSKEYNGGLFPVWIVLKEPVESVNSISWKMGYSEIAYRTQELDAQKLITADTAFFYWNVPPPLTTKIDSVKMGEIWRIDTTYYHTDTIFAIVNGLRSEPIVIEVKNILPRVTSLTVGGLRQAGDSVLTIAAHLGDKLEIELRLEKPFNNISPVVEMPTEIFGGNLTLKLQSDSLYSWEWIAPHEPVDDSSAFLRIKDKGGYGERLYKIHLVAYTDFSSVWAASEKEIVKYSPAGSRVVRINGDFGSISDIAVNSNSKQLFVVDQAKNIFAVYDSYGKVIYRNDNLLKAPTSVAVDIESNYIWVADDSGLRAFSFTGSTIGAAAAVQYEVPGLLRGLSVDQFRRNFLWFAIPERDTIGFVEYSKEPEYILNTLDEWKRPSMVSHDPTNGMAWIADSSRIVAIDTDGNFLAVIRDFGFVSAISAGGGSVWASDILTGKVYRFRGPFRGSQLDLSRTVKDGMEVGGFLAPTFISTFAEDGSAWVMDRGAGMAVRVDSVGKRIASGIGLIPSIGKTIQKVE
ncbi:MAG: hypothetical protein LBC85_03745 [Fibromonadaceae bacterium]|jgi:hypothetical protein|nr:hypothetical protein [Fibromonadaceae bacterium]